MMTQEEYELILQNTEAHEVFDINWSRYSSADFISTFLPHIAENRTESLVFVDGVKIFQKSIKEKTTYRIKSIPIVFNFLSCLDQSPIALQKNKVVVKENEIIALAVVDKNDNIVFNLTLGNWAKQILSVGKNNFGYYTENNFFQTNLEEFRSHFASRDLHQESLIEYFMSTRNLNTKGLKKLLKSIDIENYEAVIRPGSNFSDEDKKKDFSDENLVESLEDFLKKVDFGTVNSLDGEIQIYRSKKALSGNLGKEDTDYFGEFGFDRYDEASHGTATFAQNYFPIIKEIGSNYRSTILALWPPFSKLSGVSLSSIKTTVNKTVLWCDITQEDSKNATKNSGFLFFDTGNDSLKINGERKGKLSKDGITPFSVGDIFSFEIECTDILRDFVHVVLREGSENGKIIGIFTTIPNYKIFTSDIRLVDVEFGSNNSLVEKSGTHGLSNILGKYCNENSFNQAFINLNVLTGFEKMVADSSLLKGLHINDAGEKIIAKSSRDSFFGLLYQQYNDLLSRNSSSEGNRIKVELNTVIKGVDYSPSKELAKLKKEVAKAASNLAILADKKFNKQFVGEKLRLAKTYADVEVKNAQDVYEEKIVIYRNQLWLEIKAKMSENPKYVLYNDAVYQSVMKGETLKEDFYDLKPDLTNKIVIFLVPGIAAITEELVQGNGIAGIAQLGDGIVEMFNLALGDPELREQLIAHEIGHAFGISHPFEQNKKSIDETFENRIKKLDENKKSELEELKSIVDKAEVKGIEDLKTPLENYYSYFSDEFKKYAYSAKFFTSNLQYYEFDFVLSKSQVKRHTNQELSESDVKPEVIVITEKEIIDQYNMDIAEINEQKEKLYKEILDVNESSTKENFLDYGSIHRKSFWYWQWIKMHENTEPLKVHIL